MGVARAISEHDLIGAPVAVGRSTTAEAVCDGVKRCADLVVASLLLVVLVPLMLVIGVLVRLTSPGPALFRHQRVGADGRHFTMWKFRTMEHGAAERIRADPELREVFEGHQFKLPDRHSLITPLGRLLRRSSLDELPQLVQVITGRMSLVGVRPIEPAELATRSPRDQAVYVSRRPGITGLWQVQGRSAITYHERLHIDHQYVTNWSLALDLRVLALTPFALVRTHQVA